MRHSLQPHPQSRCEALTEIAVDVARIAPRRLRLRFELLGETRHVLMPPYAITPERRDGLWRHSCFEAFLRAGDDDAYCEFNFAPSHDWAAYRFSGYRSGMTEVREVKSIRIELDRDLAPTALTAWLELDPLAELAVDRPWRLGLAAVIEERNGCRSYWALAHPPGAPDFHHRDCFALELAAAKPI